MVDEFPGHDAAVADHTGTTNPQMVARLVGELHELLALPLDEGDYALAAAELGMEVSPPDRSPTAPGSTRWQRRSPVSDPAER
ncbi:contact-dependent growth inhibition system immunity protein [Streptomyces sp. ISL-63]|uniref:contact-dependent growth inhibition system immunity protein n=1 Tax=Streptomyces sp. ISL-63 TaxID=2819185 RepID=UPI0027E4F49E|nr:contact-dependent growth inhibition system immunity protein [Streptomyces sp. ISL-63]